MTGQIKASARRIIMAMSLILGSVSTVTPTLAADFMAPWIGASSGLHFHGSIQIVEALYWPADGRESAIAKENRVEDVTSRLQRICGAVESCAIDVSNAFLGVNSDPPYDPMPGMAKKLTVTWTCGGMGKLVRTFDEGARAYIRC